MDQGITEQVEVGDQKEDQIPQILDKYALKCEFCYFDKIENPSNPTEVKLLAAKVTSLQPNKKSYIIICTDHFKNIDQFLDKFTGKSTIGYSVQPSEIKRAKLVTKPQIDNQEQELREAFNTIKNNYCCRILKWRLSKIDQQIQTLNSDNVQQTIENAFQQKKRALETTAKKFKLYVDNQEKMSPKQLFLIYHYYRRLQRKSEQKIEVKEQASDQKVSTISQSMSVVL